MSFALPIVATRIPSLSDVITEGKNGLLFNHQDPQDLANTIKKVLTNHDLFAQLSEGAFESIKKHKSVDDWATELISIYENVVSEVKKN